MPSGFSMSASVAPHTWISSTEACTSDSRPSRSGDGEDLLAVLRIARAHDVIAHPRPGVLLEEAGVLDPAGTAHQRQRPVDDVGRDPRPQLGVELGEPLLGDAGRRPQHPVGVRERDRQLGYAALASRWSLARTTSATSLSALSPLNTAWRTIPSAVQPRSSTSATSERLHPAHVAPAFRRRRRLERRARRCEWRRAAARGPRQRGWNSPSRRGRHRRACPCRERR